MYPARRFCVVRRKELARGPRRVRTGYVVWVMLRRTATRSRRLAQAVVLVRLFGDGLTEVLAQSVSPRATSNHEARAVLAIGSGEGIRPGELAERLGVLPAASSRIVRNLESAGIVERRPFRGDGRGIALHLSARGRTAVRRLDEAAGRYLAESEAVLAELVASLGGTSDSMRTPRDGLAAVDELTRVGALIVADTQKVYPTHSAAVLYHPVVMALSAGLCAPRPAALADYLGWTRPRMSAALKALESHGLLERHALGVGKDGRGVELTLTAAGEDVARAAQRTLELHAGELADCLEGARLLGARRRGSPHVSPGAPAPRH